MKKLSDEDLKTLDRELFKFQNIQRGERTAGAHNIYRVQHAPFLAPQARDVTFAVSRNASAGKLPAVALDPSARKSRRIVGCYVDMPIRLLFPRMFSFTIYITTRMS